MYQRNQKPQYDECLICNTPLLKDMSLTHLMRDFPVCKRCMQQFQIIDWHLDFHHHPMRILYQYDEFFKTLLFQYKGLYDIALKDTFLCMYDHELSHTYKNFIIAVVPSASSDNQIRGFAPMATIASSFSSHVFTGLYKKEDYKQSNYSYEQRKEVIDKIGIRYGESLSNKSILILDDVITSGSTLLACLKLIESYHPQKIEFLVLSTNQTLEQIQEAIANQVD
ncbi:MAG: hypothetical protein LUH02_07065 [Erysipelotrichaceae bacterium]|nr:hypothetical protein [Erysipelotrichaceae bacterium]